MGFRTFFILIFCNLIWSAHPVMGKLVLRDFSPVQGAWLRYTSAWAAYFIALAVLRSRLGSRKPFRVWPERAKLTPRRVVWLILAGVLPFCFSPLLQMRGLAASQATDNALIVAMEPMFTVILAWAFLREKVYPFHLLAFVVALAGFALLVGLSWSRLTGAWDPHFLGNIILLVSLTGESAYTVIGRKLTRDFAPSGIYTAAITSGALLLTVVAFLAEGFPDLHQLTWASALGLFWLGPIGTGLTYLLWVIILVRVPVASIAITLFIQPVMGALWGHLFLGESLSISQAVGGLLILMAVMGQAWGERRVNP